MNRARPGTPSPRGRSREKRAVLRNVPPTAPRKGVNGQKSARAQRERVRARRSGTLRRTWNALRLIVGAGLITAALCAAGWAGWRAFENHDLLALRDVEVVGNTRVAKAAILAKAGLELGEKLPWIKLSAAETAVRAIPGVGEVEIRRMYPSRIEIRVKEKQPVAMGYARGWYGMAPDGTTLPGLDWGRSDLPVVDGFAGLDTAGRAALGRFLEGARSEYPELYANFSQLAPRGSDGMEIILRDRKLKVLLPLERAAPSRNSATPGSNKSLISLEFLRALQDQQAASLEPGKTVDLRVEGFAYVR
jgi:cell division septal protein FtsQ